MDTLVSNVMELVSVIMPAYNASKYIAASIESVLAQTYLSWELIIVDDGSIDNTASLVKSYCEKDCRIKYIYQENARQGRARNNGIANSSGGYIAFLDSDDLWLPEKLSLQVAFLQHNKADLIFSGTYLFENEQKVGPLCQVMNIPHGLFEGEDGLKKFLAGNQIPTLTVLCQRSVIEAAKGFTEEVLIPNAEDYHLWLKLLLNGAKFWGMPQVLAAYRVDISSTSGVDRQNLRFVVEAMANLRKLYPQRAVIFDEPIKRNILNSLYYSSLLSDKVFFAVINRFLKISNKQLYSPLLSALETTGARQLAVRLVYFIFNYL